MGSIVSTQGPHSSRARGICRIAISVDRFDFGRRLRAARAYEGIGRPELSERLGVSESLIAQWEKGRRLPEGLEDRLTMIQSVCLATEAPPTLFPDQIPSRGLSSPVSRSHPWTS